MDRYASLDGGLAIAIPQQLKGLEIAWKRFGRLPWSTLVSPAAEVAKAGFAMHPYLHYILSGPFTFSRAQVPYMRLISLIEMNLSHPLFNLCYP